MADEQVASEDLRDQYYRAAPRPLKRWRVVVPEAGAAAVLPAPPVRDGAEAGTDTSAWGSERASGRPRSEAASADRG